jgi:hypothetical protein
MRRTLMVAALTLLPTLAQAQQPSYLRDADNDYGTKRIMAADAKNGSVTANLNLWNAVDDNQKRWVDVKDERELWLGRNQIYENVISLRSKDKIQQALDEQRSKLGVADPKVGFAYDPNAPKNVGYQRMGESNPYDNTSYLRYYDDKGQLKISEVRGLKADLERQRADIEKHRERLVQSGKEVEDKYSTAIDAYNKADTARQDLDKVATDLAAARARSQQEQTPSTSVASRIGAGPYRLTYRILRQPSQEKGPFDTVEQVRSARQQLLQQYSRPGQVFGIQIIDASGNRTTEF